MSLENSQSKLDRDPAGSRERRITDLKDLVGRRAYDVPSEDVAASIIRGAMAVVSPLPLRPH